MSGFIFGVIGFYLWRAGKRHANFYWSIIGALLMIYPLFSPNAWFDWGIGFGLCGVAYAVKDV